MDKGTDMKPKTLAEKILDKEASWAPGLTFPHCDARVLHAPIDCVYCAGAKELQKEREELSVSNTGRTNRKWPCPADKARSSGSLNSWTGNRAYTQADIDREEREWERLRVKFSQE